MRGANMADIKIIVDSGSDIPQDIADKYNIGVISFLSIFGTEQYVQRTEITNEQFEPYYCTECGEKITDPNITFCPNCGKKLK